MAFSFLKSKREADFPMKSCPLCFKPNRSKHQPVRQAGEVKRKAGLSLIIASILTFLMIFLMPVGRKITGVRRGLAPDGIIEPFPVQPFSVYAVLYSKPA